MSELIDITAFKTFVPGTESLKWEQVKPFIVIAQDKYLKPRIGAELLDDCLTEYAKGVNDQDADFKKILPYLQRVVAHYGFILAIPSVTVNLTGSGLHQIVGENKKPLFQWQKLDYENLHQELAAQAIDDLLKVLAENKAAPFLEDFIETEEYARIFSSLINFASEFQQYYNIGSSAKTFQSLRPIIKEVEEFYIKPSISREFFDALIEELQTNGELSDNNEKLMMWLGPALCHYTVARSIGRLQVKVTDEGFMVSSITSSGADASRQLTAADRSRLDLLRIEALEAGEAFMQNLKKFMNDNANDYAEYKASDAYTAEDTDTTVNNANTPSILL